MGISISILRVCPFPPADEAAKSAAARLSTQLASSGVDVDSDEDPPSDDVCLGSVRAFLLFIRTFRYLVEWDAMGMASCAFWLVPFRQLAFIRRTLAITTQANACAIF
jgi:hypothetical protein